MIVFFHVPKWLEGRCPVIDKKNLLPGFYDENMVGFFIQGPGVIYVYWELSVGQWRTASEVGGIVVRLYKIVESVSPDYDYSLVREAVPPPYTGKWYFDGLDPDTMYCFEVGCKFPDGSFFPLIKSEIVKTPPLQRLDAMPRIEVATDRSSVAINFRELQSQIIKEELDLGDVLRTMPFYMGIIAD